MVNRIGVIQEVDFLETEFLSLLEDVAFDVSRAFSP
jgi:hypothetical protein